MSRKYPGIPHYTPSFEAIGNMLAAMKETIEILTNQRRQNAKADAAVTFQDLVDLELIAEDQIPDD